MVLQIKYFFQFYLNSIAASISISFLNLAIRNWLNCLVSKILEQALNAQMSCLVKIGLDPQSPIMPGKVLSLCMNRHWLINDEVNGWGEGHQNGLTDQRSAFNVLQPDILVVKLKIFGFSDQAVSVEMNIQIFSSKYWYLYLIRGNFQNLNTFWSKSSKIIW